MVSTKDLRFLSTERLMWKIVIYLQCRTI